MPEPAVRVESSKASSTALPSLGAGYEPSTPPAPSCLLPEDDSGGHGSHMDETETPCKFGDEARCTMPPSKVLVWCKTLCATSQTKLPKDPNASLLGADIFFQPLHGPQHEHASASVNDSRRLRIFPQKRLLERIRRALQGRGQEIVRLLAAGDHSIFALYL